MRGKAMARWSDLVSALRNRYASETLFEEGDGNIFLGVSFPGHDRVQSSFVFAPSEGSEFVVFMSPVGSMEDIPAIPLLKRANELGVAIILSGGKYFTHHAMVLADISTKSLGSVVLAIQYVSVNADILEEEFLGSDTS
jgi:hypothetical protein